MGNRPLRLSLALALICLAGCGGGGGGARLSPVAQMPVVRPTAPAPAVDGADAYRTAEYHRMGALDQIRAADAYALGYTGAGVLVGVVDFNFDFASSEVDFHPESVGVDPTSLALYEAQTGQPQDPDRHGFAIAATIAARKNDLAIHGVAFGAQILAVDYFSNVNERQLVRGGVLYHVSDPWTYVTDRGARIVNVSFGYEAGDVISGAPRTDEAYTIASPAVAVANGALLVMSAGNGAGPNPSLYNLHTLADLRTLGVLDSGPGGYIVAGAVDANNQITSFSNRAGTAASNYMVAPGMGLIVPWNGALALLSGTSFSAPLISGAAAIVLERWPHLTARQVAEILFASATDLGAPGIDSVYGHGLLNLAAALQPIGATTLAVAGGEAPAADTALVLGPAFGDGRALKGALAEVMMLDGFGRDFTVDLSSAAVAPPSLPDLDHAMRQRLGWRHAGFAAGPAFSFLYGVRRDPADGRVPFQASAGPADHQAHQTLFRFAGATGRFDWSAGKGLSLRDGMVGLGSRFPQAFLADPFSPAIGAAAGVFVSFGAPIGDGTRLSVGASHADNQGLTENLRTPFDDSAETIALRFDHDRDGALFALELGGVLETGGLMGSLAAGGLRMAERASTGWVTATVETALDARFSLKGSFTLAAASATRPKGSLISAIGPVHATSFAFGVAGVDLFRDGDVLSLAAGQPLRAEHAPLTLLSAVAREGASGALILAETQASLAPSGRELDLVAGYRFSLGGFDAEAGLAYAIDANHAKGEDAVLALFTLSRAF